mmetsp:Transcript_19256/g.73961  ORF Transcript_19256/g.73961 Transcript_19256/m.73961 type:complete len:129 (+) Transcript_19256:28-414(+)
MQRLAVVATQVAGGKEMGDPVSLSSHVLDTTRGKPAVGMELRIERHEQGAYREVFCGKTNSDGRVGDLPKDLQAGRFRATFDTEAYCAATGTECFYPRVVIEFYTKAGQHYHIPLLVSPFGYTTYRGS